MKFKNILLVSTIILGLTACEAPANDSWNETNNGNTYFCADKDGKRVPEANCESSYDKDGNATSNAFLWYMIGHSMGSNNYYAPPAYGQVYDSRYVTPQRTYKQNLFSSASAQSMKVYAASRPVGSSVATAYKGGFNSSTMSSSSVSRGGFGYAGSHASVGG